jgi:hypothetical protein
VGLYGRLVLTSGAAVRMLPSVERHMAMRFTDYRFWILLTTLAVGLLVACSSGDSSPGTQDGATETGGGSMTQG